MSQPTQLEGANAVRFWAAMSVIMFHVTKRAKTDKGRTAYIAASLTNRVTARATDA